MADSGEVERATGLAIRFVLLKGFGLGFRR